MNKKRGLKLVLLAGVVLFLIACTGSVTTELYFSDIFEIAYDQDLIYYTKGTIEIESFSDELDEELNENIKKWFRDAKNFRIIERDFDNFVVADIVVPIINYENYDYDNSNDFLTILVDFTYDGSILLGFELNETVAEMIDDYLSDNYFSSLEIANWDFTIDLKNDTREEYLVELFGVYANEEPLLYGETYIIDSREAIMLRFGDIIKDYAYLYGDAFFGVIYWEIITDSPLR